MKETQVLYAVFAKPGQLLKSVLMSLWKTFQTSSHLQLGNNKLIDK